MYTMIRAFDEHTGVLHEVPFDNTRLWTGYVPIEDIVRNPEQPRRFFCGTALKRALKSFVHKQRSRIPEPLRPIVPSQRTPIKVIPHEETDNPQVRFKIDDGERRWRLIPQAGFRAAWVVFDPSIDNENLFADSFAANFCREGHTHAETAAAIEKLRLEGYTYEEIAEMAGKESPSWAYNEHRLLKLHPDLLVLLDPPTAKKERLSINVALLLCKLTHEDQLQKWQATKSKPRNAAYHTIRAMLPAGTTTAGRSRKPSDDRDYIKGKLERIKADAVGTQELTDSFLECYRNQSVDEELRAIEEAGKALVVLRLRLAKTGWQTDLTRRILAAQQRRRTTPLAILQPAQEDDDDGVENPDTTVVSDLTSARAAAHRLFGGQPRMTQQPRRQERRNDESSLGPGYLTG